GGGTAGAGQGTAGPFWFVALGRRRCRTRAASATLGGERATARRRLAGGIDGTDGTLAVRARLREPFGVALDRGGDLYLSGNEAKARTVNGAQKTPAPATTNSSRAMGKTRSTPMRDRCQDRHLVIGADHQPPPQLPAGRVPAIATQSHRDV